VSACRKTKERARGGGRSSAPLEQIGNPDREKRGGSQGSSLVVSNNSGKGGGGGLGEVTEIPRMGKAREGAGDLL